MSSHRYMGMMHACVCVWGGGGGGGWGVVGVSCICVWASVYVFVIRMTARRFSIPLRTKIKS